MTAPNDDGPARVRVTEEDHGAAGLLQRDGLPAPRVNVQYVLFGLSPAAGWRLVESFPSRAKAVEYIARVRRRQAGGGPYARDGVAHYERFATARRLIVVDCILNESESEAAAELEAAARDG